MKRDTERAVRAALGGRKKNKLLLRRYLPALVLAAAFFALVCFDLFVFPLEYLWAFAYSPNLPPRGEGELRVHFIDVGQGDCTVLEFPDGKTMIVDGGDGRAETHMRVLGYCRGLGIDTFDWALLTHADSDHAGGLDDALNYFGADTVFLPAAGTEGEGYREVRLAAERAGARLRTAQMFESGISSQRERFYYWMLLSPRILQIQNGGRIVRFFPLRGRDDRLRKGRKEHPIIETLPLRRYARFKHLRRS